MTIDDAVQAPAGSLHDDGPRFAAFFHELDAWTEYWDIYQPQTNGHYYLGSDAGPGLLSLLIPGATVPPVFSSWRRHALGQDVDHEFERYAAEEPVASAVAELDDLVAGIFARHFGEPSDSESRQTYLRAIYGAGADILPPAVERAGRVAPGDPRARTAGRHTIEADMMWFVWALEIEAASVVGRTERTDLWALLLAGVAVGSAANFARRGHRRTRSEYRDDEATRDLLWRNGLAWAGDIEAASLEVHELYQLREWGSIPAR